MIERGARADIKGDVGDRDMDDVAALVAGIGIGFRMHRVVVVLGVGRINGHERYVAKILAAFQRRGLRLLGLAQRGRREHQRNVVGMNGDQADGLFAGDRAQPFPDLAGGEAEPARTREVDGDEIAVLGAVGVGLGDIEFAAGLLLVDGDEPSATCGQRPEHAEHAVFGMIDDLDDAAPIGGAVGILGAFDAEQHAVANACGRERARMAWTVDADLRRLAAFGLVPFGRRCDQLAVGIAAGDVGHHGGGQACGLADLLAVLDDRAGLGEVAQQALQLGAVGILQAELARDFPGAGFAGIRANEGDDGVLAWKAAVARSLHFIIIRT